MVGLTKYVHFWTFDKLPGVGFAYEYIQPEVRLTGPGLKASGFGDPLTGFAVWMKPSRNSTLGVQSFVSVPIGAHEVTNDFWASYTRPSSTSSIRWAVSAAMSGRFFAAIATMAAIPISIRATAITPTSAPA
jgi:hypothetical protein